MRPVPFPFPSPLPRRPVRAVLVLLVVSLLAGCQSLGYYTHVATGHARLLAERRPVQEVIDDPATSAERREHLAWVLRARTFASERLGLPANGSYHRFVDLDRSFVTWAVFATPEFSIQPLLHCFPIAGCVAYRGYFDEAQALALADRLRAQGLQAWVGGVGAYSTLGWFEDPLLSTMLDGGVDAAVSTMFHELVHQKLYVRDDTAFNESLAVFVEREGMAQWRRHAGWVAPDPAREARSREFTLAVLELREALERVYRSGLDEQRMRLARDQQIEAFRATHRRLRQAGPWRGDARYDRWVNSGITNASLVPFGLYDRWVEAFARLFVEVDGDWTAFHEAAARLAALPPEPREAALRALLARQSGATSSSSTSNTSEAPGGMRLPAPRSP